MENSKKLELTLCGMLPYGLKTKDIEFGFDGTRTLRIETLKWSLNNSKPLLHSLDKLTEPIIEGGLIPIVELYKIAVEKIYNYVPLFKVICCDYDEPTFGLIVKEEEDGNRNGFTLNVPYEFGKRFEFDLSLNNENTNGYSSLNQFELFEKLKEWHFNLFDLPSEMYIEKSLTT